MITEKYVDFEYVIGKKTHPQERYRRESNSIIEIILIPYRITTCFNKFNVVMHVYIIV
jgi:hypothetical protein